MTFSLHIGDAHVHQVTEVDRWTFALRDMFPAADDDADVALRTRLQPDFTDPDTGDLVLAIHTYVVRLGDTVVLVDAGNGNLKQRPVLRPHHMFETDYLDRLAQAGFAPEDVDVVVTTHLHPDHCGGNTVWDGTAWVPTFPNARHLFAATDLDALAALAASAPADGVEADFARTYEDSVRPVLDTGRWAHVAPGDVLAEHGDTRLVARAAPGHTAGHVVFVLDTPDGGAVFAGDTVHHPVQLVCPDLVQGGDADPAQARATRTDLLRGCLDRGQLLMTAHFPVHAPLRVTADASGEPSIPAVLRQ